MNVLDIINSFNPPKFLIQMHTADDLKKNYISFFPIKDNELQYLSEIGYNTEIELFDSNDSLKVVKKLRELGKNNTVIINITDKKNFNNDLFNSDISYDNVIIKTNFISKSISLNEYVYNENILYSMIKSAQNLSPLEKYLYAYDVVKRLKEYKENNKDKMLSRDLYPILFNNYIVCSGFTTLLGDLLDKLDVPNAEIGVKIGLSSYKAISQLKKKFDWDKISPSEKNKLVREQMSFIPQESEGHSRLIVNIIDPKYDVNGLYFSDVTWDNDLKKNFYNHCLMTSNKVTSSIHKIKLAISPDELLYSKDIYEFYDKINYILNHKDNSDFKNCDDKECLKELITNLINILDKLDYNFTSTMKSRYPSFRSDEFYLGNQYKDLLFELGSYISERFNKEINGNIILKGVKSIYNDVYEDGIWKQEIQQIIDDNNSSNIFEFSSDMFNKKNK